MNIQQQRRTNMTNTFPRDVKPIEEDKLGVLLLHDGKRRRNIAGDLDAVVLARRAEQKLEIGEALRVLSFGESRSKYWNLK